jgi:putative addiction module killer protein
MEIRIEFYETVNGKRPFEIWLRAMKEQHTRARVLMRLDRLKLGNFGDCKTLQEGVSGIRIYYGKIGSQVVLLLCGGDKNSQDRDIAKAKEYLKDYQSRGVNYGKK